MALNGNTLGDLIMTQVDLAVAATPQAGPAQRQAIFRAIGAAIVTHITTQGTVVVASVSGVTTGPGTSGPGTGTIL